MDLLFGTTILFLAALFFLGGGARADIQSLVLLRPLAVFLLGYGLWGLTKQDIQPYRFLYAIIALSTLLVMLHLLPLPYSLWSNMAGRALIVESDRIAAMGEIWRPLSLIPTDSWNALFAMVIPLAALVLFTRISAEQRYMLLGICILIGLFSAAISIFQLLGPADGKLYFYRITNRGTAVGLFANRNHNAVFLACLLPMLAAFASGASGFIGTQRFRLWASVAVGAVVLLLIMISGSRAGLLVAVIGLCATPALYKPDASRTKPHKAKPSKSLLFNNKILVPFLAVLLIVALGILSSRAASFDRLFGSDDSGDLRFQVWLPIAKLAWAYFPFGSGLGTFADVYKIHESQALLSPEYLNHAHNDFLELLMTAGVPGLLLLLSALTAWGKMAFQLFKKDTAGSNSLRLSRVGAVIILMLAIASLVDYPLRTPALSGLLVLAAVWMAAGKKALIMVDTGK